MKKLLFIVMMSLLTATVAAQSVADAARQNRTDKKASQSAKVIDNDVIPSVIEKPSPQTVSAEARPEAQKSENAGKKDDKAQDKPAAPAESEKKPASADNSADSWKKKV